MTANRQQPSKLAIDLPPGNEHYLKRELYPDFAGVARALNPKQDATRARAETAIAQLQIEVAERRAAEAVLRESEARFRATFEQAAVGMALMAPDGRWLSVNRKLCDVVGYSRAELESLTSDHLTDPADRGIDSALRARLLAEETTSYSRETRYIRKDGRKVWVNVMASLVRTSDNVPDYLIVVVEDIQQRKHFEDELRANEERLLLALRATNQHPFDFDLRRSRITLTPEYYRMLGYEPSDAAEPYEFIRALLHPDDLARMDKIIVEYREGKRESHREELRQRTKSGEWSWVYSVGKVVERDGNRLPTRIIGTNTDINERKLGGAKTAH
jgi:PAS domain S-box-containing protein